MTVRLSRLWWGRDRVSLAEEVGRGRRRIVGRGERLVRQACVRACVPEGVVALPPRTDVEVRERMVGVARRRAVVRAPAVVGSEIGAEVEVLGPQLDRRRRLV